MPGPTRLLAELIAGTGYDDLPAEVVARTKLLILDTLASQFGGYQSDLGHIVADLARQEGGAPRATVVGSGLRTSTLSAVATNARFGWALDSDDTFNSVGHNGNPTIATALAVCEANGRSGRDLLAAVAVGFDVGARAGASVGPPRLDLHSAKGSMARMGGGMSPYLASAAAAAHALRLEADRAVHALGLLGYYLPVSPLKFLEMDSPPLLKSADAGWQALGGLQAAYLAERGAIGFDTLLEGERALWKVMGYDHCTEELMTGELGQRWFIMDTTFKKWPCQRWMHYSLTALEWLLREESYRPDEVERVVVLTNGRSNNRRFHDQNPPDGPACQYSYPHTVAMLLLGVPPGPLWFSQPVVNDPRVQELRSKVEVTLAPESKQEDETWFADGQIRKLPSGVEITARDRTRRLIVEHALGDPWDDRTRFGELQIAEKLHNFADPLGAGDSLWWRQIDRIVEVVRNLEEVPDVRELTALLAR
jgi:2-methylcitrate dehydratase PrpD